MSGKSPNLKKLRNLVNEFDNKLNLKRSQTPIKNLQIDEELHSALKTKPKDNFHKKKEYDKELLNKAKLELEEVDKQLRMSDDLCLSSESENSKLSSSFRITKSSAFFLPKASKTANNSNKGLKEALETIEKLEKINLEKEKRIVSLEEKLLEKQKIAENSMKKLSQTTKIIKNNEKEISK